MPSLRYHLTVHTVHKCHLDQLNLCSAQYLKKWLGIPKKGCTSLNITSPHLLGIKPIAQIYLEGHLKAYINSSLVSDSDTKEALKCAVEREGTWAHKSSTIVQCKEILTEISEEDQCFIPSPENTSTNNCDKCLERFRLAL